MSQSCSLCVIKCVFPMSSKLWFFTFLGPWGPHVNFPKSIPYIFPRGSFPEKMGTRRWLQVFASGWWLSLVVTMWWVNISQVKHPFLNQLAAWNRFRWGGEGERFFSRGDIRGVQTGTFWAAEKVMPKVSSRQKVFSNMPSHENTEIKAKKNNNTSSPHRQIVETLAYFGGSIGSPAAGMILLVVLNACQCLAIIGFVDVSWPPHVEVGRLEKWGGGSLQKSHVFSPAMCW